MAYIEGEGRSQGTLFPVVLDDLVPGDQICRVMDAFVSQLNMVALGFERSKPAETGRPGYDPRALLKLYLYGYLNQVRSSRRQVEIFIDEALRGNEISIWRQFGQLPL